MTAHTYEQLRDMKVQQLRDIAKDLGSPELEGYSTMHKEQLLPLLCKVLHIPTHHIAAGQAKAKMKADIRQLRQKRDEAQSAGRRDELAGLRRQIHVLKHKLRVMAKNA